MLLRMVVEVGGGMDNDNTVSAEQAMVVVATLEEVVVTIVAVPVVRFSGTTAMGAYIDGCSINISGVPLLDRVHHPRSRSDVLFR